MNGVIGCMTGGQITVISGLPKAKSNHSLGVLHKAGWHIMHVIYCMYVRLHLTLMELYHIFYYLIIFPDVHLKRWGFSNVKIYNLQSLLIILFFCCAIRKHLFFKCETVLCSSNTHAADFLFVYIYPMYPSQKIL